MRRHGNDVLSNGSWKLGCIVGSYRCSSFELTKKFRAGLLDLLGAMEGVDLGARTTH